MKDLRSRLLVLSILLFPAFMQISSGEGGVIYVLQFEGEIFLGAQQMFQEAIEYSENSGAICLIVELNTNGGELHSLERIIQDINNSRVPVVIYVSPKGAVAFSAGTFLVVGSHIAAMAPGTTIGAAQPITMEATGEVKEAPEKVVKATSALIRNIAEEHGRPGDVVEKFVTENLTMGPEEALESGVIDLIANDVYDLIEKIDGKEVSVLGGNVILKTKGARIEYIEPSLSSKIFNVLSNPVIAYVLLMLGIWGLIIGFYTPGFYLPETIGAVCLLLSLSILVGLGANVLGLLLILLGFIFFLAELKTPTFGFFSTAAVISLLLGSILLIPWGGFRLPGEQAKELYFQFLSMAIAIVLGMGGFVVFAFYKIVQSRKLKPVTGYEGLIGQKGVVVKDILKGETGVVKIKGELWKAKSDQEIRKGEEIVVKGVEGLILKVERS